MAKKTSFEDKMKRLEDIVTSMEKGELQLEEALKHFEEGVKVYRECLQWLDNADRTIEKITEEGAAEPFEAGEA